MREGEETMERNLRYVDMGLIFCFDVGYLYAYEKILNPNLSWVVRQCGVVSFGPDHHVTRTNTVLRVFWDLKTNSAIQVAPVNPRPFLQELTGKMVAVKLKWGLEYRGFLVATDAYMNLQVRFPYAILLFFGGAMLTYTCDRLPACPLPFSSDGLNLYTLLATEH